MTETLERILYLASAGKTTEARLINQYFQLDVAASASLVMASGGSVTPATTVPTTAKSLEIVSAGTNDTAAGNNARTIRIFGVDANFEAVDQTVSMNGLTAVALPTQMFRVNGWEVATAGTGTTNESQITLRESGGGSAWNITPAGEGRSMHMSYSCPVGKVAYMIQATFQSGTAATAETTAPTVFNIRRSKVTPGLTDVRVSTVANYQSRAHSQVTSCPGERWSNPVLPGETIFVRVSNVDATNVRRTLGQWTILEIDAEAL